jgi:hypothetical protein
MKKKPKPIKQSKRFDGRNSGFWQRYTNGTWRYIPPRRLKTARNCSDSVRP